MEFGNLGINKRPELGSIDYKMGRDIRDRKRQDMVKLEQLQALLVLQIANLWIPVRMHQPP